MKRTFVLLSLLVLMINTYGNKYPKITEEPKRSILSDSTYYGIFDFIQEKDFINAKGLYDSLKKDLEQKNKYDQLLFLGNQYSYWMRVSGDRETPLSIIAEAMDKASEKIDSSHFEFLFAYYNRALYNFGLDLKEELFWYETFLKYNPKDENKELKIVITSQCANNYFKLNNWKKAWEYWDYCRENIDDLDNPIEFYARLINSVGQVDMNITEILLKKVLAQYDTIPHYMGLYAFANLAYVYMFDKNYDEAEETAKQGINYYDQNKSFFNKRIGKRNSTLNWVLITSLIELNKFDEAHEQLRLLENNQNDFADAMKGPSLTSRLWSKYYYNKGQYDSALVFINKSEKKLQKYQIKTELEIIYSEKGNIYSKLKDYNLAIENYENAIKELSFGLFDSISEPFRLIPPSEFKASSLFALHETTIYIIQTYLDIYDVNKDEKLLYKIIELSHYANKVSKEKFRNLADEDELISISRELKNNCGYGIYASHIISQTRSEYIDTAFMFSDIATSFNFKYLQQTKNRVLTRTADSLLYDINKISIEIANVKKSQDFNEDELQLKLDLLRSKMLLKASYTTDLEILNKVINPSEILNKLDENTALLKTFIKGDSIYTICFTKHHEQISLNSLPDLEIKIRKFKRSIRSGEISCSYQNEFYNNIIKPVVSNLQGLKNIIIIADEHLSGVPFGLFRDEESNLLIEKYNIKYAYTTDVLGIDKIHGQSSLLAIAPGFMKSDDLLSENFTRSTIDSLEIFNFRGNSVSLMPIKNSIQEVKSLEKLFKDNNSKTKLLTKEEASKDQFMMNIENRTIIHIATHGISNGKYESGLFFSNNQDNIYESFLRLSEVYKLNLDADLVVLSACRTGVGTIEEGEGVMALPRGFIYAGVPNVIASLWKVHDERTKDLMVAFYMHLLEDKVSYAEALRLAKLDCIEKGFLPLDWAGFILIGN